MRARLALNGLMYDQPSCVRRFKWKSKNSDVFSVGVPQLKMKILPGTVEVLL